jgi:hypothetical protein
MIQYNSPIANLMREQVGRQWKTDRAFVTYLTALEGSNLVFMMVPSLASQESSYSVRLLTCLI